MAAKAKTAFLLIVLMLATQMGLARHMTVHAGENSKSHSHTHSIHECDLCLLAKIFSKTVLAADVVILPPLHVIIALSEIKEGAAIFAPHPVYLARAPPVRPL